MGFLEKTIKQTIKANIRNAQKQRIAEQKAAEKQRAAEQKAARAVKEKAEKFLSTAQEAADIVNTTTKPDIFFPKYALIIESLEKLIEMGTTGEYDTSRYSNLQETYQDISNKFTAATNAFIERSFEELQAKLALIEADKAKTDLLRAYFKSIEKYIDRMEAESINHLYALKEQYIKPRGKK